MRARVVGLGQRLAGDDCVGLAILDQLRTRGMPPEVELYEAAEPTALLPLLETPHPVFVVDAVVGEGPPGDVVVLAPGEIGAARDRPLSSHGLGVAAVLALAPVLFAERACPRVTIVGVRIAAPVRGVHGMSHAASDAVERAAQALLARLAQPERQARD